MIIIQVYKTPPLIHIILGFFTKVYDLYFLCMLFLYLFFALAFSYKMYGVIEYSFERKPLHFFASSRCTTTQLLDYLT